MKSAILQARWVLPAPGRAIARGGVLIGGGLVRELLAGARAVERAAAREGLRPVDLGELALTPGLVDPHAHLELSGTAGRLSGANGFPAWIAALLELRRSASAAELGRAVEEGVARLLRSGTTTVGDIDSGGGAAHLLAALPIRAVVHREALDAHDPRRTAHALAKLRRALPRRRRTFEGLAPHAPYTVSPALFRELGRLARRRRIPVTVHWAESEEEIRWLERGDGPFAALLESSPRRGGLELIGESGLLDPRTRRGPLSLVHGNFPAPGDPERLARARAVLVHCPGTHRHFERPPFPVARYRAAGVPVALGTDSLASNAELDTAREMALFRGAAPEVEPAEVWRMATVNGARALGLEGLAGELRAGAWADLCAWRLDARRGEDCFDALTGAGAALERVWIGGRRCGIAAAAGP